MRTRTPKSHPARTSRPMAIAAAAQSRETLLSGSARAGVTWLAVIGRAQTGNDRGVCGANPSIPTVASSAPDSTPPPLLLQATGARLRCQSVSVLYAFAAARQSD